MLSSLAVLALSASALANPFSNLVHLHPRPAQHDTRVSVVLYNKGISFRDVKIDGHIYTVTSHQMISVKAPVGTVVYADSKTPTYHRGDAIVEVTPKLNNQQINLD
jgi:hypothetical protein